MSTDNINDFLFGGGGKAFSFENIGDKVKGTIVDARISQQTSLEDNTPLTWQDGSPRMQLVVTLQTDIREDREDGQDDDGIRKLYAKGGSFTPDQGTGKSMKDAIADAVRGAKAKSLDEGGTLTVAYTGVGKKTNRGYSAPKLFTAKYEAPKASVAAGDLFDD